MPQLCRRVKIVRRTPTGPIVLSAIPPLIWAQTSRLMWQTGWSENITRAPSRKCALKGEASGGDGLEAAGGDEMRDCVNR